MDPRREIAFVMHLEKGKFTADETKQAQLLRPHACSGMHGRTAQGCVGSGWCWAVLMGSREAAPAALGWADAQLPLQL